MVSYILLIIEIRHVEVEKIIYFCLTVQDDKTYGWALEQYCLISPHHDCFMQPVVAQHDLKSNIFTILQLFRQSSFITAFEL